MDEQAYEPEETEKPEEQQERASIFISYKHGGYDEAVALRLYETLRNKFDVFMDRVIPPGAIWPETIEDQLKHADFVVALISADSVRSENVLSEIQIADRLNQTEGRPTIIPVRLAYSAPYDVRLNSYLSRFHEFVLQSEDYSDLPEQLEAVLDGKPVPLSELTAASIDDFLISDSRKKRIRSTFVEPSKSDAPISTLLSEGLVWITGDPGVRDYVAWSLAAQKGMEKVYEVPKSRSWSKVCDSRVRKSAIVFRDALPASHFNEETSVKELRSLSKLVEQENFVIVTSSDEALSQAKLEMLNSDFKDYASVEFNYDSYDTDAKERILKNLIDFSWETGDISETQHSLVESLLNLPGQQPGTMPERFRSEGRNRLEEVIRKWTPSDIERFVTLNLHQIARPEDVIRLLRRNVTLDDEIHSWFISLDEATRCFVMALTIFPEADKEELWKKYKALACKFRRINPQIALVPFGICRERAAPYISTEGSIVFVDERVAETISLEVAKNYREYFIETITEMKRWSTPARLGDKGYTTEEDRKLLIEETKDVRTALARMVGNLMRLNPEEFVEVLDHWAVDPSNAIRDAVGIALEQTASSRTEANNSLNLLWKWYTEPSSDKTANRILTVALALGRIASATPEPSVSLRALNYLKRLAEDKRDRVRLFVSLAAKQAARKVALSNLEDLVNRLARDKRASVRINVADALNVARFKDAKSAADLLNRWASSDHPELRWTAICSLIILRKTSSHRRQQERVLIKQAYDELQGLLLRDPALVADSFLETIGHDRFGAMACSTLEQLLLQSAEESKNKLVSAFTDNLSDQLESKLLSPLRVSARPRLLSLLIDVRCEQWKQLLDKPNDLLDEFAEGLDQEHMIPEVYKVLTLLLKPEPEGCRQQLMGAFVACLPKYHARLTEVLLKLKKVAPSVFEPVSLEVHREAVNRLLFDPPALVDFLIAQVTSADESDESRQVIESLNHLAMPEPHGRRRFLVCALAEVRCAKQAEVDDLLQRPAFRSSPILAGLLLEVPRFTDAVKNFTPMVDAKIFFPKRY